MNFNEFRKNNIGYVLTEHLGKLGFDRTVNRKMFCQKNAHTRGFCHKQSVGQLAKETSQ